MADPAAPSNVEHLKNGFTPTPESPRNLRGSTSAFSTSVEDPSQTASLYSRGPPACQARPKSVLKRISFGRSKGNKELAVEDLENSGRAQKAEAKALKIAAFLERKVQRDREERNKEDQRQASKQLAKQSKVDRAERKAEEKRVKKYYGIRGFDPNAGMLGADRESLARSEGKERPPQVSEKRRTLSASGAQAWGLEFGKPKTHEGRGHFSGQHENCGRLYGSSAAADGQ